MPYTVHTKQNQYGGWEIHDPSGHAGGFKTEAKAIEHAMSEADLPGNACSAIITSNGVIDMAQSKELQ